MTSWVKLKKRSVVGKGYLRQWRWWWPEPKEELAEEALKGTENIDCCSVLCTESGMFTGKSVICSFIANPFFRIIEYIETCFHHNMVVVANQKLIKKDPFSWWQQENFFLEVILIGRVSLFVSWELVFRNFIKRFWWWVEIELNRFFWGESLLVKYKFFVAKSNLIVIL